MPVIQQAGATALANALIHRDPRLASLSITNPAIYGAIVGAVSAAFMAGLQYSMEDPPMATADTAPQQLMLPGGMRLP